MIIGYLPREKLKKNETNKNNQGESTSPKGCKGENDGKPYNVGPAR